MADVKTQMKNSVRVGRGFYYYAGVLEDITTNASGRITADEVDFERFVGRLVYASLGPAVNGSDDLYNFVLDYDEKEFQMYSTETGDKVESEVTFSEIPFYVLGTN